MFSADLLRCIVNADPKAVYKMRTYKTCWSYKTATRKNYRFFGKQLWINQKKDLPDSSEAGT